MKFIERITAKKQIINLTENANLIYKEAFDCLKPSRNVYYHYDFYRLRITRSEHDISLQQLQLAFISFESYINQLVNLKTQLENLLTDEKLKKKFLKQEQTIKSYFTSLYFNADKLIQNIREIPDYKNYDDLKLILQYLQKNKLKLQKITKIEEKNIEFNNTQKTR